MVAIAEMSKRRDTAIRRLHKGLTDGGITDPLRVLAIVTTWLSLEELEKLAEFQDRGIG